MTPEQNIEGHAFNALTESLGGDPWLPLSDRLRHARAVVAAVEPVIRAYGRTGRDRAVTIPPLGSEADARALPSVAAIFRAVTEGSRQGVMEAGCKRMLRDACSSAGVEMGAYDEHVLAWLAMWEPQVCAAVAGWIERAHESGRQEKDGSDEGSG